MNDRNVTPMYVELDKQLAADLDRASKRQGRHKRFIIEAALRDWLAERDALTTPAPLPELQKA